MIRRLLFAASVLSLLLCLAVVALWVRSETYSGQMGWAVPILDENGKPDTEIDNEFWDPKLFGLPENAPRPPPRTVVDCRVYGLRYCRGICAVGVTEPSEWPEKPGLYCESQPAFRDELGVGRFGFGFRWMNMESRWLLMLWHRDLFLPFWFLFATTAALPATTAIRAALRSRTQKYRAAARICLACGYDLRASKDRCPECGTFIPVEAKA